MALHHPDPRIHERILSFGGSGLGKSYDWLKIAEYAQKTGSDAIFYVLDTDNSIDHMLVTEFGHLENIRGGPVEGVSQPAAVFSWEPLQLGVDVTLRRMRPQDWLIVDMVGPCWNWAQAYFTEKVFDKELDSYFLAMRAADKNQAFEGWTDWSVINKLWTGFTNKLLQVPGHLYCTATQKAVNGMQDAGPTMDIFGAFGQKPDGQKNLPHNFHTVLWKTKSQQGAWRITTCKDRGRRMLQGQEVRDFVMSWMIPVAGWRL